MTEPTSESTLVWPVLWYQYPSQLPDGKVRHVLAGKPPVKRGELEKQLADLEKVVHPLSEGTVLPTLFLFDRAPDVPRLLAVIRAGGDFDPIHLGVIQVVEFSFYDITGVGQA